MKRIVWIGLCMTALVLPAHLSCTSEAERREARIRAKTKAVEPLLARIYQGPASIVKVERHVLVKFDELIPDFAISIPVPPDLPGQRVIEIRYKPTPSEIIERQQQKYLTYYGAPGIQATAYAWEAKIEMLGIAPIEPAESLLIAYADIAPETLDGYTGSAGIFDLNSNEVIAAADEAVGTDTLTLKRIVRIWSYVDTEITVKKGPTSGTAKDILGRRSGSASDKAIAICALLRRKRIPTRLVQTKQERLVQVYLPPYGWLTIDPQYGSLFVGGDLILHCQHDAESFLAGGWHGGISIRKNGSWLRSDDPAAPKLKERILFKK